MQHIQRSGVAAHQPITCRRRRGQWIAVVRDAGRHHHRPLPGQSLWPSTRFPLPHLVQPVRGCCPQAGGCKRTTRRPDRCPQCRMNRSAVVEAQVSSRSRRGSHPMHSVRSAVNHAVCRSSRRPRRELSTATVRPEVSPAGHHSSRDSDAAIVPGQPHVSAAAAQRSSCSHLASARDRLECCTQSDAPPTLPQHRQHVAAGWQVDILCLPRWQPSGLSQQVREIHDDEILRAYWVVTEY